MDTNSYSHSWRVVFAQLAIVIAVMVLTLTGASQSLRLGLLTASLVCSGVLLKRHVLRR